ncbi:MFS transporter [Rubrobacter calidifluminis]|uniref:MFS transporter n=1 Tax=Rubrobacter calidifluminis TaxID=1392640 RepID=UPI0023612F67|nr:MFS transporter [Rubrobacter calidifluminis]
MFTDVNQGAVAALLPFLEAHRGISLAAAGALVFASTASSSIIQPLFGVFSDRRPFPALMPLGILAAGTGISLVGVAPGYLSILLCVVLSGMGVAAFHPEAARFANYVSSGSGRARGMSFFSVGGNAGFAIGPAIATPLVVVFGLPGTLFMIIPAALMSAVLFHELPRLKEFRPGGASAAGGRSPAEQDEWGPFVRLTLVVAMRSLVYFGLVSFVSSYYHKVLGTSEAFGNTALTLMLLGGAAGTLVAGPLADRLGRKRVLLASMCLLAPLLFVFSTLGPGAGMVALVLIGASTVGTFAVTTVMGQEYLPGRIGFAAGVTMGFSIGLGGAGAVPLGAIADHFGLHTVVVMLAFLPVVGAVLAYTLPRRARSSSGS